ncbi:MULTISPECIES: ABC transporter substrate-binding protein [unclassified Actinobaculum]|uniref:ABC transporter substrate-binding protein n=1 Tax=unclassified Actinobaculum TaxID=2609299 RepID=UPI000D52600B|nr:MULTISPECIES: ABC transporter substrate-binding protein [unclassified Actinobaculum]AWE42196.1 sugar ABC transporter substrate-binding protein [Actinobaculum sp. 313]RTE50759.1 carbohydrate ABC transporter substrate-binding protein [Actinobaculum sp. 352]
MQRCSSALAILASAALVLTACSGSDTENTTTDSSGPTVNVEDLDLPDLSGQTLNVAADWSGAEQENFEAVLDEFERQTGAETVYTSLGNNVATTLGTQIEGGKPPNVALIPQPGLMTQLAQDGSISPLADDVLEEVQANYSDTWLDLGTVDGTSYGVWFKAANKSTIWYNVAAYEDAGVDIPKSWDDFTTTLQTVSDSGVPGLVVGADVGWPLTDWFENVYLRTAGPEMYDQLANHEIPWTDESVKEALTILGELWGNDDIVLAGGSQRTFPDSVTAVFRDTPEGATVYEGDFVAGNITDQTNAVVGEDANFYPFPSIDDSPQSVMGAGNVAVAFDDGEGTQALMKYLASPTAANIWIAKGGFTSPNQNADMALYPDDTSRDIAQQLVDAEVFRFDLSDLTPTAFGGTEGQGFWAEMITFYQNPSDVDGTAQRLEEAAVSAYGG